MIKKIIAMLVGFGIALTAVLPATASPAMTPINHADFDAVYVPQSDTASRLAMPGVELATFYYFDRRRFFRIKRLFRQCTRLFIRFKRAVSPIEPPRRCFRIIPRRYWQQHGGGYYDDDDDDD